MRQVVIRSARDMSIFSHIDSGYSYRGQSDESWPMATTLERFAAQKTANIATSVFEDKILAQYQSGFSIFAGELGYDPRHQDPIDALSDIQHYGGPTRLLDWTSSFNAALFFAVFRNYTTDAAVYCLRNIALNAATFDINDLLEAVPCAPGVRESAPPPLDKSRVLRLHAPKRKNPRIINQAGHFIFAGSADVTFQEALSYSLDDLPLQYHETEYESVDDLENILKRAVLVKAIIPKAILNDARKYLLRSNITTKTLFPDSHGAIQSLYEISLDSI